MKLYLEREKNPTARSLKGAFVWDDTPEGHEFWSTMHSLFEEYKKHKNALSFIVAYMRKKAELISEETGFPESIYFTREDEDRLRAMKANWPKIREKLLREPNSIGYCPFCAVYFDKGCEDCPYAIAHGQCLEEGSSFKVIAEAIKGFGDVSSQALKETREEYDV